MVLMTTLQFIFNTPIVILQSILTYIIQLTVLLSLLYTLLYRLGIIQRLLQHFIEHELSKACNNAQITMTTIEFTMQSPWTESSSITPYYTSFFSTSILRVTELMVHTPQVEKWKWDSPLVARVGKLDVAFNVFTILLVPTVIVQEVLNHVISTSSSNSTLTASCSASSTASTGLLHPILPTSPLNAAAGSSVASPSAAATVSSPKSSSSSSSSSPKSIFCMKSNIKEIYSAQAYDVQVFIEKRGNVFNFHLLDPKLDIPDADQVLERIGYHTTSTHSNTHTHIYTHGNGHENKIASTDKHDLLMDDGNGTKPLSPGGGDRDNKNSSSSNNNNNNNKPKHQSLEYSISSIDERGVLDSQDLDSIQDHENDNNNIRNNNSMTMNIDTGTTNEEPSTSMAETKANEIIMSIVGAVSTLGHAVHQDGTRGLSDALRNQKDGFVSQLRKVQHLVGEKDDPNKNNNSKTTSNHTSSMAKEGIQVIKQVSKVVEKNVLTMKEKVLDSYTKPPPLKSDYKHPERPDLFRVGFVELRDVRIFTKEMISRNSSSGSNGGVGTINSHHSSGYSSSGDNHNRQSDEMNYDITTTSSSSFDLESKTPQTQSQSKPRLTLGVNGWSKPMYVKEVRLYPSELCPPSYSLATILKEKNTVAGVASSLNTTITTSKTPTPTPPAPAPPAIPLQIIDTAALIGLPIEQVSNIIMTKVLTEVAKTNTGQLLTNAFTEVFAWFDVDEA